LAGKEKMLFFRGSSPMAPPELARQFRGAPVKTSTYSLSRQHSIEDCFFETKLLGEDKQDSLSKPHIILFFSTQYLVLSQ